MTNDHNMEILSGALNAVLLAGDFETCADPRGFIRNENLLIDAAVDCGMKHDHAYPREWASAMVAYWLAGPIKPGTLWAGSGYARNYKLMGEAA